MKVFSVILLGLLSLPVLSETVISISPVRPAHCDVEDYSYVNWIYQVEKISEDEETVVYEFMTEYGSCTDNKLLSAKIDMDLAVVDVDRKDFFIPGLQKRGTKTKLTELSPTEVLVEVTFDKKFLFKKKNERKFGMFFMPGTSFGPIMMRRNPQGGLMTYQEKLYFTWNVELVIDEPTNKVEMRFTK